MPTREHRGNPMDRTGDPEPAAVPDLGSDFTERRSVFAVPGMDCPSEENLIRLALDGVDGIVELDFDLQSRHVVVVHDTYRTQVLTISRRLASLQLGARLVQTAPVARRSADIGERILRPPEPLRSSVFEAPKMDCPSEEQTVRMALDGLPAVRALRFDLGARRVEAVHEGEPAALLERLEPLGFGVRLLASSAAADPTPSAATPSADHERREARTLWTLLAINGSMFALELIMGLIAQSTGLIADSLDMLADAFVYGVSLYAVGRAATLKLRAAHLSGVLQIALAAGALFEVARRFVFGSEPQAPYMIAISLLALAANVSALLLIHKHRGGGAHMKASWIFSANDVIANAGVILAGVLVAWTGSRYPDLVIGTVIAVVVMRGALRILRLRG